MLQPDSSTGTWIYTSLPDTSIISPGENINFGITLDASDLVVGDYYADLVLEWYNPVYAKGLIPIRMHVRDKVVSMETTEVRNELILYPNPSEDFITIQVRYPGTYSLRMISLNGQVLLERSFSGSSCVIDLSSFQKGVYFITIRSKDFVTTRKIIKL